MLSQSSHEVIHSRLQTYPLGYSSMIPGSCADNIDNNDNPHPCLPGVDGRFDHSGGGSLSPPSHKQTPNQTHTLGHTFLQHSLSCSFSLSPLEQILLDGTVAAMYSFLPLPKFSPPKRGRERLMVVVVLKNSVKKPPPRFFDFALFRGCPKCEYRLHHTQE